MGRTNFRSEIHGFHFDNSFTNSVFRLPAPFNVDIQTYGRCGGMAFAALDYFHAGVPIPTHVPSDFAPGTVPPDGHPLSDYLYGRLMDSFVLNGLKFAGCTAALDHPTWLRGAGVPESTRHDEVPRLIQAIDANQPVALGLIAAGPNDLALTGIGDNHQVVAYGYDLDAAGSLKVYIYDNNYPDQEVVLTLDMNDRRAYALYSHGRAAYRGFFVEDYTPVAPRYWDLALDSGVTVSDRAPLVGAPLTADFQVTNVGASAAHLSQLAFLVAGPAGQVLPGLLGGDGTAATLAPGAQRRLSRTADPFGTAPGSYTIQAVYESASHHTLALPAASSASTGRLSVLVRPVQRYMRTAVDRLPLPINRNVTFMVMAVDAQLGTPVPGARVWIAPPAGAAPQDIGDANTTLTYTFRRVKQGPRLDSGWAYPTGTVQAPGYVTEAIEFGFPDL